MEISVGARNWEPVRLVMVLQQRIYAAPPLFFLHMSTTDIWMAFGSFGYEIGGKFFAAHCSHCRFLT